MSHSRSNLFTLLGLFVAVSVLQGCTDESATFARYGVDITNLTNDQPFSPIAAALHRRGYEGWRTGAPASTGLEELAEGGDNSAFLNEMRTVGQASDVTSGVGVIAPAASESLMLSDFGFGATQLTLAAMLVNSNDGFVGVSGASLAALAPGESMAMYLLAYDAGTEGNDESSATVPGPAGGGEGFRVARNDRNFVAVHSGVVGSDGGLATSALNQSHRFDQPVARLTITRLN